MHSLSEEGFSRVRLDFARGTNIDEAANDLRAALDRVRDDLPLEAEPPEILKLDLDNVEVLGLVATSTRHLEELTRILEREIARRLKQIPGVGSIELTRRHLPAGAGGPAARSAAGGGADRRSTSSRRWPARTSPCRAATSRAACRDLYLRPLARVPHRGGDRPHRGHARSTAGPVRVGDVAEVVDGYEDVRYLAEVNGVPSVTMGIQKQSGANTVEVAERLRAEVERINGERDDIHLTVFSDSERVHPAVDRQRPLERLLGLAAGAG